MKCCASTLSLWLPIATALCAGCCTLKPDENQIDKWVREELPHGSTDADVRKFCVTHQFFYSRHPDDGRVVQLDRGLDGCDSQKPIAMILITYDAEGRLTQAKIYVFGLPWL